MVDVGFGLNQVGVFNGLIVRFLEWLFDGMNEIFIVEKNAWYVCISFSVPYNSAPKSLCCETMVAVQRRIPQIQIKNSDNLNSIKIYV